jgi:Protein of unknown function (DUF3443)
MKTSVFSPFLVFCLCLSACSSSNDNSLSSCVSETLEPRGALAQTSNWISKSVETTLNLKSQIQSKLKSFVPSSVGLRDTNVLTLTVNGFTCKTHGTNFYPNKPCVSVTVCPPNSSSSTDTNCQTISDLLLDTGSVGLRVFSSVLGTSLPNALTQVSITSPSGNLAECVQFGDGSSEWGQVKNADVYLGGEPKVTIPIHVVDSTYTGASLCGSSPDIGPETAGFNGILGVGLTQQDCGSDCTRSKDLGVYYSCAGNTCSGTTAALDQQVAHPIAALSQDYNGVVLDLPTVPLGGVSSVTGSLYLGIGTQNNNKPANSVSPYSVGGNSLPLTFATQFAGQNLQGFIDSGSNFNYFTSGNVCAGLPYCEANSSDYCPTSTTSYSASVTGFSGSPSTSITFQVGNLLALFNTNNFVFVELAAGGDSSQFDFGLPFFLGKKVYVGIEQRSASFNNNNYTVYGPYFAF